MPPLWRWVVFANLCREKIRSQIINSCQSECRDKLESKKHAVMSSQCVSQWTDKQTWSLICSLSQSNFCIWNFYVGSLSAKKKEKNGSNDQKHKKKSLLYLGVLMWWQLLRLTVNILCQFTANGSHLSTVIIKNGPGQPFLRLTVKIVSFYALRLSFF